MTNAEIVSSIINSYKALNKDDRISKRWVLGVARSQAKTYIAQRLQERSIYREDSIVSYIDCLEMIPIDTISCPIIEFKSCKKLVRSKHKVEGLIDSRYGSSVVSLSNIDSTSFYTQTTLRKYALSRNSMFSSKKDKVFYVKDGYIYIPDSKVRTVSLSYISLSDELNNSLSSCSECDCKSAWDMDFVVPDKLLEIVRKSTLQEILASRNIVEDEQPDLDSNQKSKKSV